MSIFQKKKEPTRVSTIASRALTFGGTSLSDAPYGETNKKKLPPPAPTRSSNGKFHMKDNRIARAVTSADISSTVGDLKPKKGPPPVPKVRAATTGRFAPKPPALAKGGFAPQPPARFAPQPPARLAPKPPARFASQPPPLANGRFARKKSPVKEEGPCIGNVTGFTRIVHVEYDKERGRLMKETSSSNLNAATILPKNFDRELEAVTPLDVSKVTGFKRGVHITFDPTSASYTGIPSYDEVVAMGINPGDFKAMFGFKFGGSLSSYKTVKVKGFGNIPVILVVINEWLERLDGFIEEGIFRLQPSHSDFEATKKQLEDGTLTYCKSPHIMANMLKVFFREMQPSIMDGIPEDIIMDMSKMTSSMFGRNLSALPGPVHTVLVYVFDILMRVCLKEEHNMMTIENLAVCMGPNLLRNEGANPMEAIQTSNNLRKFCQAGIQWRYDNAYMYN